ncbi:aldo/keto reductase [Colletotrichum asianum]|uniref:Aldo/keto reductase n=1 Tax=Colletotrichum asianum TaxID=702518 RepID=A0A8H3WJT6_9PEZI|nr:aldo/keto reductase [Colletotrichum asianum]
MASKSETAIPVIFGAMTIGSPTISGLKVTTVEDVDNMLDLFQSRGHNEIDTARLYGGGTTETYLADAKWEERGIVMGIKLYPNSKISGATGPLSYMLRAGDVRRGLLDSLKALNTNKLDLWYLHGPDRETALEETPSEVNKLHKEGHFNRFGISNFMSWDVAKIWELCDRNGWIKPTVYQGAYNALHRGVELELIPCLRHYNIALYEFQPLAAGFHTSRQRRNDFQEGSRDIAFDALEIIQSAATKHGLSVAECAFRWLSHHSALNKEKGDKIIIGASSLKQLEENLDDLEKGPLPEDVVKAMEEAWLAYKAVVPKYFH